MTGQVVFIGSSGFLCAAYILGDDDSTSSLGNRVNKIHEATLNIKHLP